MALGVAKVQPRFEDPRLLLGDRLEGCLPVSGGFRWPAVPVMIISLTCICESRRGRPTVPARVLATVMILQAHEGLSDQEAVDRLERDLAWQAAAGVHCGYEGFHPTVLVGARNRLRASTSAPPAVRGHPGGGRRGGGAEGSGPGAGLDAVV